MWRHGGDIYFGRGCTRVTPRHRAEPHAGKSFSGDDAIRRLVHVFEGFSGLGLWMGAVHVEFRFFGIPTAH